MLPSKLTPQPNPGEEFPCLVYLDHLPHSRIQTGAGCQLRVGRLPKLYEVQRTSLQVVWRVKALTRHYSDAQIAQILNQEGQLTGTKTSLVALR